MTTTTPCPHCRALLSVNLDWQGRQIRCAGCKELLTVPPLAAAAATGAEQVRDAPRALPVANAVPMESPAPPPRRRYDEDRPPRLRSPDSSAALLVVALCVGGGLLLIGGVVALIFVLGADSEPEPLAWNPAPPPPPIVVAPMPFPQQPVMPPIPQVPPQPFPQIQQQPFPQMPQQPFPQMPQQPLPPFPQQPFPQMPQPGFPGFPGFRPQPDVPPNADPITRAVAWMKFDEVHQQGQGVELLERTPVDPKRRDEVVRGLKAIIDRHQPFSPRSTAARVLGLWGTRDDVPYVLGLLNDNESGVQQGAIDSLGKLKDARAGDVLVEKMRAGFERDRCREALKQIGSGAEAAVLRLLDEKDNGLRINGCEILKVIGTKVGHAALLRLTREQNQDVANAAREALPEKQRPAVWGRQLILTLNVHLTAGHSWQELEPKLKALADDPDPICSARQSGDYMWVELSPVRGDAQTFARRVTFARVVAVHNDRRLIYLDPGP